MNIHYLDNSATTKPSDNAVDMVAQMMTTKYGNPSSLHKMGLDAELMIEDARDTIAKSLDVSSNDIYFTSGSTESNNTVVFGVAEKQKKNGKKIVSTSIEHSSVMDSLKELENRGFNVTYIKPNENGDITLDSFRDAIDQDTILVCCMLVNNEVGSIQPVEKLSEIIKEKNSNALLFVDAVQAYGKIEAKPKKWNVDFLSISSHKVHGPKNVGALYIKNTSKLVPLLFGGEQQKKVRPGTEISSLIPAFGEAVKEFNIQKNYEYVNKLNTYAKDKLKKINEVVFNSKDTSLPYILNISIPCIKSETMLHFLETKNVFVSSGSACAKGKKSYVLQSLGIDNNIIDGAIRISFSKFNTMDDIDALVDGIKEAINSLSKKK